MAPEEEFFNYLDNHLTLNVTDPGYIRRESAPEVIGDIISYFLSSNDDKPGTKPIDPEVLQQALTSLPQQRESEEDSEPVYRRVPLTIGRSHPELVDSPWHLSLITASPMHKPLYLEVCGDVFFGRSAAGLVPDVDLTLYNAAQMGVSRQHALIRATPTQLSLADLGSVNGTFWNGTKVEAGQQHNLTDHGVISFGTLHFLLRLDHRPSTH